MSIRSIPISTVWRTKIERDSGGADIILTGVKGYKFAAERKEGSHDPPSQALWPALRRWCYPVTAALWRLAVCLDPALQQRAVRQRDGPVFSAGLAQQIAASRAAAAGRSGQADCRMLKPLLTG